ncbi:MULTISPECIES: hypothetical protein [Halolamina]|uniref:Uncharacterized protein n=1 Tax=Halolamina pelagica TaxID=699431 RepID=A0A1I5R614_9EURY|nr:MULTISPECIES: hypothetical protein [Halolamina]NHX35699.1 hypothetical protein [Halolamina sp. R1-12]SFP53787.1 hypothetical protein SAMN05216277_104253 [Halolamina pelagica]
MTTYTLVVRETSSHDGVDADVLDEDGFIETTTQFSYGDYGVHSEREDDRPDRIEEEFTVEAGSIDVQLERNGHTFAFRALADGEEAARVEISDADWDLQA